MSRVLLAVLLLVCSGVVRGEEPPPPANEVKHTITPEKTIGVGSFGTFDDSWEDVKVRVQPGAKVTFDGSPSWKSARSEYALWVLVAPKDPAQAAAVLQKEHLWQGAMAKAQRLDLHVRGKYGVTGDGGGTGVAGVSGPTTPTEGPIWTVLSLDIDLDADTDRNGSVETNNYSEEAAKEQKGKDTDANPIGALALCGNRSAPLILRRLMPELDSTKDKANMGAPLSQLIEGYITIVGEKQNPADTEEPGTIEIYYVGTDENGKTVQKKAFAARPMGKKTLKDGKEIISNVNVLTGPVWDSIVAGNDVTLGMEGTKPGKLRLITTLYAKRKGSKDDYTVYTDLLRVSVVEITPPAVAWVGAPRCRLTGPAELAAALGTSPSIIIGNKKSIEVKPSPLNVGVYYFTPPPEDHTASYSRDVLLRGQGPFAAVLPNGFKYLEDKPEAIRMFGVSCAVRMEECADSVRKRAAQEPLSHEARQTIWDLYLGNESNNFRVPDKRDYIDTMARFVSGQETAPEIIAAFDQSIHTVYEQTVRSAQALDLLFPPVVVAAAASPAPMAGAPPPPPAPVFGTANYFKNVRATLDASSGWLYHEKVGETATADKDIDLFAFREKNIKDSSTLSITRPVNRGFIDGWEYIPEIAKRFPKSELVMTGTFFSEITGETCGLQLNDGALLPLSLKSPGAYYFGQKADNSYVIDKGDPPIPKDAKKLQPADLRAAVGGALLDKSPNIQVAPNKAKIAQDLNNLRSNGFLFLGRDSTNGMIFVVGREMGKLARATGWGIRELNMGDLLSAMEASGSDYVLRLDGGPSVGIYSKDDKSKALGKVLEGARHNRLGAAGGGTVVSYLLFDLDPSR